MKRLALAIAAATIMMAATPALAHTSVRETNIAENATLARAPAAFTIVFSGPTGLANVSLTDAALLRSTTRRRVRWRHRSPFLSLR
jgi:methionine-rich copper-binding protein CopC